MPEAISIGGILLDTGRIVLAVTVLAALVLMRLLAGPFRVAPPRVERLGILVLLGVAVGARLAFVAAQWPAYREAPWTILYFWQPGYDAVAGLLGGAAVAVAAFIVLHARRAGRLMAPVLLGLAGPFAVFTAIELGAAVQVTAPGSVVHGSAAPELRMSTLNGGAASLSELRGHPVIVNVWATWCPPCRREIPLLNETYRRHADAGLRVVGVNRGERPGRIEDFLAAVPIDYDVWVDPRSPASGMAPSARLLERARSPGLPTTLFINAQGTVQQVTIGELRRATIQAGLQRILGGSTTYSFHHDSANAGPAPGGG